jgi:hypothetical protein
MNAGECQNRKKRMVILKGNKSEKKRRDKRENDERKITNEKKKSETTAETKPAAELAAPSYKVTWIPPDEIMVDIANRCRPVVPAIVKTLAAESQRMASGRP